MLSFSVTCVSVRCLHCNPMYLNPFGRVYKINFAPCTSSLGWCGRCLKWANVEQRYSPAEQGMQFYAPCISCDPVPHIPYPMHVPYLIPHVPRPLHTTGLCKGCTRALQGLCKGCVRVVQGLCQVVQELCKGCVRVVSYGLCKGCVRAAASARFQFCIILALPFTPKTSWCIELWDQPT